MFVLPIKISSEVSISSNFSSSELLETCSIHHYPGSRRPMQNSHSTNFYNIGNFYQINLQFSQKRKTCVGRCIDYSIVSGSEGFRTQMMPIAQTAMYLSLKITNIDFKYVIVSLSREKRKNILQNSSRPKTENSIKENWSIRKMAIKIQEPVDSESSVRGYNLIPLPT